MRTEKKGKIDSESNKENNTQLTLEDKPASLIDKDFLYVTIEGKTDTLMNGHSLTIPKGSPVKFKIGYKGQILYNKAYYSLDETFRKKLAVHNYWDREIKTDSVKWKLSTQNIKSREFNFTPSTSGTFKLEIDAGDALPVVLTDTVGGVQNDTIVSGNRIKENKIAITINVADGGILHFKPVDDHYRYYGFDDALTMECQNAGDYNPAINIANTTYYVPTMYLLPNNEVNVMEKTVDTRSAKTVIPVHFFYGANINHFFLKLSPLSSKRCAV